MALVPRTLRQEGPLTLGIQWEDGHDSHYEVRHLRLSCRCASCVDEWSGEKKLRDTDIPKDVRPRAIDSVGRYALKIVWSDGHDTGFYTFDLLRKLCECQKCRTLSQ